MDKHILHNVIHADYGNNSKLCPVCNGSMSMDDTDEMMCEANKILDRKQSRGMMYSEDEKVIIECKELDTKDRNDLKDESFAYIDSSGGRHLPINDAAHVRNALARFNQTKFESDDAKKKARAKVDAAADKFGVDHKDTVNDHDEDNKKMEELVMRPLVDLFSFAEGKDTIPDTIKLIPVGKYNMVRYGSVDITKEKIQEMIQHFNEGIRAGGKAAGLPIDIEHGTTQYKDAAAGWIKEIILKDDGGYGRIDWTPLGKKLLKDRIYKFYSPEFHFDYVDPEHSFKLNNVMTGGGLVNKPMIKDDLPAIVNKESEASNNLTKNETVNTIYLELNNNSQKTMKLSEILAKAKTDRNSDEQKFIIEHKSELTLAEAEKEGLLPATQLAEGQTIVEKSKLDSLISMAEAGKTAADKLAKAELKEKIKGLVFSETGTKMAADQVDVAVELAFSMSEANRELYFKQLAALPETKLMKEVGSDAAVTGGKAAGADLEKKAKEFMEADKKLTYREAISKAVSENPTQFSEYKDNLPVAAQEK